MEHEHIYRTGPTEILRADSLIVHMWTLRPREGKALSQVTELLSGKSKVEARVAVSWPLIRSLGGGGAQELFFWCFLEVC